MWWGFPVTRAYLLQRIGLWVWNRRLCFKLNFPFPCLGASSGGLCCCFCPSPRASVQPQFLPCSRRAPLSADTMEIPHCCSQWTSPFPKANSLETWGTEIHIQPLQITDSCSFNSYCFVSLNDDTVSIYIYMSTTLRAALCMQVNQKQLPHYMASLHGLGVCHQWTWTLCRAKQVRYFWHKIQRNTEKI